MAWADNDRYLTQKGTRMFCTECGATLKNGVQFCTECGAKTKGDAVPPANAPAQTAAMPAQDPVQQTPSMQQTQPYAHPYAQQQPKKVSKAPLIVVLVLLLVAAMVAVVVIVVVPNIPFFGNSNEQATVEGTAEEAAEGAADEEMPSLKLEGAASQADRQQGTAITRSNLLAQDFILPKSDGEYYTAEELSSLSDFELYVARNEIYAYHGRMFVNADLQQHFASKSWYKPRYTPEEFDRMVVLNMYEKANAETILAIERSRNSPYAP